MDFGIIANICAMLFEKVEGDIIWQIDADEFYFDLTHVFIKDIF